MKSSKSIREAMVGAIIALTRPRETEALEELKLALIALEGLVPAELDLPLEVEE